MKTHDAHCERVPVYTSEYEFVGMTECSCAERFQQRCPSTTKVEAHYATHLLHPANVI